MSNDRNSDEGRRKDERVRTDILVWWPRDWEVEPINLLDISKGGMLCEFPEPLQPGTKVDLQFEVPEQDGLIHAHCEVIHVNAAHAHFHRTGLKMLSIQGMNLATFIHRLKHAKDQSSPIE